VAATNRVKAISVSLRRPDAKFPCFYPGLPSASLFMCGVLKAGGSGGVGG
jgi:hypothetical protein